MEEVQLGERLERSDCMRLTEKGPSSESAPEGQKGVIVKKGISQETGKWVGK